MIVNLVTLVVVASTVGPTAEPTRAVQMTVRSGRVIGAASACVIEAGRRLALREVVFAQVRAVATGPDDLLKAEETYDAAVRAGANRIRRSRAYLCFGATTQFDQLERACVAEGRPNCALP